jgi:hypothetical protein
MNSHHHKLHPIPLCISTQQWVELSKSTIVEIDFGPMVIAKEMGRMGTIPLTSSHYNPFNAY